MADTPALARPASLRELFIAFTVLALQGFGGVIAVAQRELCERRRWLDAREFVDMLASAQVLPGPNVCNLSLMIGDRFFGWRGALTALAGMILAPMALMLLLAWGLGEASSLPQAQGLIRGALGGIAAVAAGQIIGTVLKLSAPLREHELGWPACLGLAALALALVVQWHWPLVQVLLSLGGAACLVSYALLKRQAARRAQETQA
ncbi:chromate transporter [Aquabacterium commune]|uniref:Chromate transporter n=1 Tax=Aquabacterium commune TaxID=70586 RepID=A0A4R6RN22_9BURK|nr:chromate transporter [Aquabacterium commune]TDP88093.1 chromate transporter [Aquabacterium commune]